MRTYKDVKIKKMQAVKNEPTIGPFNDAYELDAFIRSLPDEEELNDE